MRRPPRIVVIDDDPLILQSLEPLLEAQGFDFFAASTASDGLRAVADHRADIVVLDNVLPDLSGLEVLRQLRKDDPQLPVLFITAQGTSQTAIEAMKLCAFDYLSKPLEFDRLQQLIERALEARRLMRVPVELGSKSESPTAADVLIGRCAAMEDVFKSIGRVALRDVPILLEGEPGTGKELAARAIYQHGSRAEKPMLALKCSDFDPAELEAALFGQSPSSALDERVGRLEQCHTGVLLLEEVGLLPSAIQSKLLRYLQDHRFTRAGDDKLRTVDVQLIATTSQDLEQQVTQGRFRSDLFYLLRGFAIALPPLRRRPEDIPLLVDHFVRRSMGVSRALTNTPLRVSAEALELLIAYRWPGNLDELQSVLQRALIESKGTVQVSDYLVRTLKSQHPSVAAEAAGAAVTDWERFAQQRVREGSSAVYAEATAEMERHLLNRILNTTQGNQARAAKILGITRGSLRKKIRTLGIALPSTSLPAALDHDDIIADS